MKARADEGTGRSGGAVETRLSYLRARLAEHRPSPRTTKARAYLRIAQTYADLAEATLEAEEAGRP